MSTPRLNLRSPRLLLPLIYRALAGRADPAQAALTQRRIEHLQAEGTELAKQLSELRARVGIAGDKADKARQAASQAALDLRIFLESYEEPAPGGLFKRLSLEQKQKQLHKSEMESISNAAQADQWAREAESAALKQRLSQVESQTEVNREARRRLGALLAEELAADVLGRVCSAMESAWQDLQAQREASDSTAGTVISPGITSAVLAQQPALQQLRERCMEELALLRRSVRGDLMVAVLLVLLELLVPAGPQPAVAMRRALADLATIFEQHHDPARRVLDCLQRWLDGEALGMSDIGIYSSGHFSYPALHRLYELLRVLAGLGYDESELEREEATPEHGSSILMLHEYGRSLRPSDDWEPLGPELLVEFAGSGDPLQRLLAASLLLAAGEVDRLVKPGAEEAHLVCLPRDAGNLAVRHAPLLEQLGQGSLHSWPAASARPLLSALGCHVLLAARLNAPDWLYAQWLQESYGWSKDDLYWWTLSSLSSDPALLRNIRRDAAQLFVLDSSPA